MRRSVAIMLVACLGLLGTASCGVLFPTSKVTYVGHSFADILSAVKEGKVSSAQVSVPANSTAPNGLLIDLKDGDHWMLSEKERIGDVLDAIDSYNASVPKSEQVAVKRETLYGPNPSGKPVPSPTSSARSPSPTADAMPTATPKPIWPPSTPLPSADPRVTLEGFMQSRVHRQEQAVRQLMTDSLREALQSPPTKESEVHLLQASNPCWYRYEVLSFSKTAANTALGEVRVYEHVWAGDVGGGLPHSWEQEVRLIETPSGWRVDQLSQPRNRKEEPDEPHGPTISACRQN